MVREIENRTECQVICIRTEGFETLINAPSIDCSIGETSGLRVRGRARLVTVQPGPQKLHYSVRGFDGLSVCLHNDFGVLFLGDYKTGRN